MGSLLLNSVPGGNIGLKLPGLVIALVYIKHAVLPDVNHQPSIMEISAITKAVIVFVLTLLISWDAAAALRKIAGATHVL